MDHSEQYVLPLGPFNLVIVFVGTDFSSFLHIRSSFITILKFYFSHLTLALAKSLIRGHGHLEWEAEGNLGAGCYRRGIIEDREALEKRRYQKY